MFDLGFWENCNSMDVFIEVLKVRYVGPEYTQLKIRWWNKGQCGKAWPLDIIQKIRIKKEDYPNWTKREG